jgi:hypothetical protein
MIYNNDISNMQNYILKTRTWKPTDRGKSRIFSDPNKLYDSGASDGGTQMLKEPHIINIPVRYVIN